MSNNVLKELTRIYLLKVKHIKQFYDFSGLPEINTSERDSKKCEKIKIENILFIMKYILIPKLIYIFIKSNKQNIH